MTTAAPDTKEPEPKTEPTPASDALRAATPLPARLPSSTLITSFERRLIGTLPRHTCHIELVDSFFGTRESSFQICVVRDERTPVVISLYERDIEDTLDALHKFVQRVRERRAARGKVGP
jgi:hypothetical protein